MWLSSDVCSSDLPFCSWIMLCCIAVPHSFIRSLVDGILGCLPLLVKYSWIVLVWKLVQVIVCSYFGSVLTSGIVRWCDNSVWLFEEPPNCLPQWLNHFTFPLGIYEDSSLNICYFLFKKNIFKNVFYACIYFFLL